METGVRYEHQLHHDVDALDVLTYENCELLNSDANEYIAKEYEDKLSDMVLEDLNELSRNIERCRQHNFLELNEKKIQLLYGQVLIELGRAFNKDYSGAKVLWLSDNQIEWENEYSSLIDNDVENTEKYLDVWKTGLKIADGNLWGSLYLYTDEEFNNALVSKGEWARV